MSLFDGYVANQEIKKVLKVYPNFTRLHVYDSPFYMRRHDLDEKRPFNPDKKKKPYNGEQQNRDASERAKAIVLDLAFSNAFTDFITITFAKDRQNIDGKRKQVQFWLNNQRNIHGPFGYVLVPEFHKDGKSLHFHGLLKDYNGNLKDSGLKSERGQIIYNIDSFRGGFTTAVKIDDIEKVAGYFSKYMTKEMPVFRNKQRYFRSNGLVLPLSILNPLLSAEDMELFSSIYKEKRKEIFEIRGQFSDNDLARIAEYGKRRYDDVVVTEM